MPCPLCRRQGTGHQPTVRVGIDLTSVAEVAASVARFGDRYVERMFTSHEQAICRRETGPEEPGHYRTESLAARFAAKEAALKVLRPLGRGHRGGTSRCTGPPAVGARCACRGRRPPWPPGPVSSGGR